MKKYYFLKKNLALLLISKHPQVKKKKKESKKNFINIIREFSLLRFLVRITYLFYALKDRTLVFPLHFHCDILQ